MSPAAASPTSAREAHRLARGLRFTLREPGEPPVLMRVLRVTRHAVYYRPAGADGTRSVRARSHAEFADRYLPSTLPLEETA